EDAPAVGTEQCPGHRAAVLQRWGHGTAGIRVPDAHLAQSAEPTSAGGEHAVATWTEGCVGDLTSVLQGRGHRPTCPGIPYPRLSAADSRTTRRHHALSVRAEGRAHDRTAPAHRRRDRHARAGIPDPRCPIFAGRYYPLTIGTEGRVPHRADMLQGRAHRL